ncbi:hypothetical protein TNIN_86541 [Trichonephila inaurata madagascariensis]|uniref:Uncharacterized protein n=1 Tax=Trichonephila inaurata madagascariensis TaxID=2747483 RepID=A0A8X6XAG5_9ARAC|nr:hypothetical protein TNIN_86541 [Trichonephila inaurata madagascariensis]
MFFEKLDSKFKDIFPSESNLVYSHTKEETTNCKDELLFNKELHTIDTIRNKYDKEELVNEVQEHDSSVESLKSLHSQVEMYSYGRTFIGDICLKKLNSLTSLLIHNCIHSNKKHFHHGICPETASEMNHFSQQKLTDTERGLFQCTVSEHVFPENDRERDMRPHTGEKSIQSDKREGKKFQYNPLCPDASQNLGRKLTNAIYLGKIF